jgi:CheY-like chemotaxis protein
MFTVLLVDDDPDVLELTRIFLERDPDLIIDSCSSAKEALQKLDHKIYNEIVSDHLMPEKTLLQ